jgi:hypothetical protein
VRIDTLNVPGYKIEEVTRLVHVMPERSVNNSTIERIIAIRVSRSKLFTFTNKDTASAQTCTFRKEDLETGDDTGTKTDVIDERI